jgi:hypothetical protein
MFFIPSYDEAVAICQRNPVFYETKHKVNGYDVSVFNYRLATYDDFRSENAFEMSEGTLYPILHALEKEKMLESYWQEFEGRNRKYYHITKKGLKELAEKKEEFEAFSASVKKVLNYA